MVKHIELGLDNEDLKNMYRTMLLSRRLDERMMLLNRAGKLPFVISCQGQEAAQVGAAYALNKEHDILSPYYRDLGVVTEFGVTAKDSMLAAFAKKEDISSGGKQMPGHFGSKKHNIITQGSVVTTHILHAVGAAYAKMLDDAEGISFATLGEGSTSQGDFHEGLNFAAIHKLPFICMIENNGYAISVPSELQYAVSDLSKRALGYGMHGEQVDGNDPLEVYKVIKEARERAVNGEGPTLIDAIVHRLGAHSSDDDDKYREKEFIASLKETDCMVTFKKYMLDETDINEDWFIELEDEIKADINEATKYAEKAEYAAPEDALLNVYEEVHNG